MDRTMSFLAGLGFGAGLMYILDPEMGRRRREFVTDQASQLGEEALDEAGRLGRGAAEQASRWGQGAVEQVENTVGSAAGSVASDFRNRARRVASGDFNALTGGRRGRWSPAARALMGAAGAGLFVYGLTEEAPEACILGTVGLALMAEGLSNANLDDFRRLPERASHLANQAAETCSQVGQQASHLASQAAESLGLGGNGGSQQPEQQRGRQTAQASPR